MSVIFKFLLGRLKNYFVHLYRDLRYFYRYSINVSLNRYRLIRRIDSGEMNDNSKVRLLVFANLGYRNPSRIVSQAIFSRFFSSIVLSDEYSLKTFFRTHKYFVRKFRHHGFGLFVWKPLLILQELQSMDENDILLYSDSGNHINFKGWKRWEYYLEIIDRDNVNALFFSAGDPSGAYDVEKLVSQQLVKTYFPNFEKSKCDFVYAGLLLLKKNGSTMQMIQDWVSLATEENLEFGRDADNGIFQLVVAKHRGYFLVEAKETNLFTATGYQVKHAMTNEEYKKLNWDALSLMPLQYRRDR